MHSNVMLRFMVQALQDPRYVAAPSTVYPDTCNRLLSYYIYCLLQYFYSRQLGRACQLVYGNLDWARAEAQLASALHVAFAAQAVQRTKLAIVGHQAPGFLDFHPNPFVMSKTFGIVLQHVGLTEYIDTSLQAVTEAEV
jgi:hypothetical protein